MRINHNIAALNTYRQLTGNTGATNKSLEKLSSGLRINRAGDDAAGLAISEKMRGQIRGLNQASSNAQDGISLIQTAEGALNETHSILQRMRELAVQSSNSTNTPEDRAEMQKELNQLTSELTRIGNNTEFNTMKLINGDFTGAGDAAVNEKQTISFASGFTLAVAHDPVKLNIGGEEYTIKFAEGTDKGGLPLVDKATNTITVGIQDAVDAIAVDVANGLNLLKGTEVNSLAHFDISGATNTLTIAATADGDFAGTAGANSIALIDGLDAGAITQVDNGLNGTGGAGKLQIGANANQQLDFEIGDMRALALEVTSTSSGGNFTAVALSDDSGDSEYALNISTADTASSAITTIDSALEKVSGERSKLGAYQNRLEHTINNLGTASENLTAAESRIRDVDMAKEMMEFTKNNILSQAAQAMLAQANMQPQSVLQLLQ